MSMNTVAISGNLGRDAELRTTKAGRAVLSFTVAVNSRKKEGDEWVDHPNWVDCVLFGRLGESIAPKMVKGTPVALTGSLSYSSWESDGQKRSKLEVEVKDIEIMRGQASADLADEDYPF